MLAGVCFSYFCFGMTTASLAPLVEPITAEFGMTHTAMGFVLGAWQLVFIASAAPCGAILDRIGIPRGLVFGGILIALSGALRAMSVDFPTLLVAVAVFGFAGPLVSVGAPKLIAQWFEGKDRGFAMGLYVSVNQLGSVTVLALTMMARPFLRRLPAWAHTLPIYAMGSLAAFWMIQRSLPLVF